jgi:hypothetical protein
MFVMVVITPTLTGHVTYRKASSPCLSCLQPLYYFNLQVFIVPTETS